MAHNHPGVAVAVLVLFGALVYTGAHGRAPDKGTQVALKPTGETYLGVRTHDDRPEGTIEVISPTGDSWGLSLYAGGVPYQERGQVAGKPGWTYKYTVHRYPIDFDTDLGAWAGFRVNEAPGSNENNTSGLDIGLRYSPVRVCYGIFSPDLLISPNQAGLGISAYPPAQTVSYNFQHLGVGLAYMADFDGGSGWMPYASLSTRF